MELEYEIISVYDVTGCLVQMVTNRTIGQDLKPGIYFLVCDEYLPTKLVKLE
jgi:hypothetical protein